MQVEMQVVESSNLEAIGYDAETSVLVIRFFKGAVYHYFEVPKITFTHLMASVSKGAFFHKHIVKHFEYRKVSD